MQFSELNQWGFWLSSYFYGFGSTQTHEVNACINLNIEWIRYF